MDSPWLTGTVYGVSMTTVFALAFAFYKCVNHRQIVSKCCGHKMDISLDINDTPMAHPSLKSTASAPLLIKSPQESRPNV